LTRFSAKQPGAHQNAEVLAGARLRALEFTRDEQAANPVLQQIAVNLQREMLARFLL
jgi:hypothetical protein